MVKNVIDNLLFSTLKSGSKVNIFRRFEINSIDYMTGAQSMQLTRAKFEEQGEAKRLKLPELIALLFKHATYTILISNER